MWGEKYITRYLIGRIVIRLIIFFVKFDAHIIETTVRRRGRALPCPLFNNRYKSRAGQSPAPTAVYRPKD